MMNNIPNYFEVVDIIDKVFLPKAEQDYSAITVEELLRRFDQVIEESGFYFKGEQLEGARRAIEQNFFQAFGRKTDFVSGPFPGFDQNNYYFQNKMSKAKTDMLLNLTSNKGLYDKDGLSAFDIEQFGSVESMKERFTREKIRDYVRSVVMCTFEEDTLIDFEIHTLANDILSHFGLKTFKDFSGYTSTYKRLESMLDSINAKSASTLRDERGNPLRAITKKDEYVKEVEVQIQNITEYLYPILQEALKKTEEQVARMERRKSIPVGKRNIDREENVRATNPFKEKEIEEEQSIGLDNLFEPIPDPELEKALQQISDADSEMETQPNLDSEFVTTPDPELEKVLKQVPYADSETGIKTSPIPATANTTTSGVTLGDLEETIANYERLQAMISENIKLSQELAAVLRRAKELQDKIEENKTRIKESMMN